MTKHATIRLLALSLVLVSGASQAGLFGKKKQAPPPPAPEPAPVVIAPVVPPPPPAPVPLEFSGVKTAAPTPAPMDRLQSAAPEVLDTVQWVAASKDNAGLPFVVVDKVNAQVYAFTPHGHLKATAPVLLGAGVGDKVLVPPDAPMSAIPVQKRITPAGRYPSKLVKESSGKVVLLIDGPNLITMHIVAPGTPVQRRAERLASPTSIDNRVSFGCINVPPAFFKSVLEPDFLPKKGIVYVLPEKQTAAQMFGFAPRAVTAPGTVLATSTPAPGTTGAMTTATTTAAPVTAAPGAASPLQLSLQSPQAPAASVATTLPQASTAASPTSLTPAPAQAADAVAAPVAK